MHDHIFTEQDLAYLATHRQNGLFSFDVDCHRAALLDAVSGKRVLVIGGAGSIGSATIEVVADLAPACLHVVDQDENRLAELVRQLRNRDKPLDIAEFRALPLDYGSVLMGAFLKSQSVYDIVLNFSAMKHVRSEKDPYSLLQILDTNIVKLVRFMEWLRDTGFVGRFFCVSTDKAANPSSLMGASKRLMEHVMFSQEAVPGFDGKVTSARFANVAFSNGSLLQAFLVRHAKQQPLAVPRQTKRYFVSMAESGDICALAALAAPERTIIIPRLDPQESLIDLQVIAERVLRHAGFEPEFFEDEASAIAAVKRLQSERRYPILLTPLDTSGEKSYEEFVASNETTVDLGMHSLLGVNYTGCPTGSLARFLENLNQVFATGAVPEKNEIAGWIKAVVATLSHVETGKNLDERM